ncbi:MAG TPA: VCBS repeat-containing protein [Pirellulales bacterium]|nr:VCBS repeat-containing protein [Pirellulales bacterium]
MFGLVRTVARGCVLLLPLTASAGEVRFRVQEIDTGLTVGYAVSLVDMNSDGRTDIVVVDTERVIWYQNPGWQVHTLVKGTTKRDNVCIAPYDIDGDGRLDFALGADWRPIDTRSGGTIQWLRRGPATDGECSVHPIGEEPTTHRMRWADLDGDGRKELIVVPMMGRGATKPFWNEQPLRVLAYKVPDDPVAGPWTPDVISRELHVAHNFWPTDLDRDGRTDILVASFEGVSLLKRNEAGGWTCRRIGAGNQDNPEARGASEIKHGRLSGDADFIATIEPWHGFQVVVYTRPAAGGDGLWDRQVLDDELKWGHAVWCADLDADGEQELIVGVRDDKNDQQRCGVRIYDAVNPRGTSWTKQLVDTGGVNVEDLAAADLDGDGRDDVVAVGRQSHNVRIYWNEAP